MRWLALLMFAACGGGFDSQITIDPGDAATVAVDGAAASAAPVVVDGSFGSYEDATHEVYQLVFVLPNLTTVQAVVSPRCGTHNHYDTGLAEYSFTDGMLVGKGACSDADGASCHWSTNGNDDC